MAGAFRLNSNGKVSVYIKPFFKTMTREEFLTNSQSMDFESFVSRFKDEKVRESLTLDMHRLKRVDKMTRNGPKLEFDVNGNFILAGCYVGKLYFKEFFTSPDARQRAIKYGYECYGKGIMDKFVQDGIFNEPNEEEIANATSTSEFVHHYINCVDMSKDEYETIQAIIKDFTRIRDLKNPLDKSESIISTNTKKR